MLEKDSLFENINLCRYLIFRTGHSWYILILNPYLFLTYLLLLLLLLIIIIDIIVVVVVIIICFQNF